MTTPTPPQTCTCDLRDRQWNGNGKCLTCDRRYTGGVMKHDRSAPAFAAQTDVYRQAYYIRPLEWERAASFLDDECWEAGDYTIRRMGKRWRWNSDGPSTPAKSFADAKTAVEKHHVSRLRSLLTPTAPTPAAGEGDVLERAAKISPISGEPQRPASAVVESVADSIGYDLDAARFKRGQNYGSLTEALAASVVSLSAELAEAKGVIGRLPKTADGVPVTPGVTLYELRPYGKVKELTGVMLGLPDDEGFAELSWETGYSLVARPDRLYSTEAAALAATSSTPAAASQAQPSDPSEQKVK